MWELRIRVQSANWRLRAKAISKDTVQMKRKVCMHWKILVVMGDGVVRQKWANFFFLSNQTSMKRLIDWNKSSIVLLSLPFYFLSLDSIRLWAATFSCSWLSFVAFYPRKSCLPVEYNVTLPSKHPVVKKYFQR